VNIRTIIVYSWLAVGIFWLVTSLMAKPAVRVQSVSSRLLHLCLTALGFVLIFNTSWRLGPLDERLIPPTTGFEYFGCVLTLVGILFSVWARLYLGTNWSASVTVKQDHTLVRNGPYAVVRHPIYTGFLFAALGTAIAFGTIRCFVGVLLLTIGFRVKSLLEERFMQEQFGAQYLSYKQDVKALVPFIW